VHGVGTFESKKKMEYFEDLHLLEAKWKFNGSESFRTVPPVLPIKEGLRQV
jgi:hypothetical protein